jgi:excinuclease ABC subunit C
MDFTTVSPGQYLELPPNPGVYIYKNSQSNIIYVGKAINLKRRVSQYFHSKDALGPKTSSLVSQIASISYKELGSEIEALILESTLIKKYLPKFNSQLTDDRSYIYIVITKETIPRVFASFKANLPAHADVFGPFPNGRSVSSLLKIIRPIFPFRSEANHPPKSCFYCFLGLCPGPNPNPIAYRKTIGKIKKVLRGNIKILQKQLRHGMKLASKFEDYEKAIEYRNQLTSIDYVVNGWHHLSSLYETIELPDDLVSRSLLELTSLMQTNNIKSGGLNRIECYDISQMGNKYFVGSMVVFQNGQIAKDQYRKFRIRLKTTSPDDQFMLKEVVWRRARHLDWPKPDLIVLDGGKPQVSAINSLKHLPESAAFFNDLSIIGLAKKHETIVIKQTKTWVEVNLPANSSALKLLQQLRNEAHRFANKYRKELMKNSIK